MALGVADARLGVAPVRHRVRDVAHVPVVVGHALEDLGVCLLCARACVRGVLVFVFEGVCFGVVFWVFVLREVCFGF